MNSYSEIARAAVPGRSIRQPEPQRRRLDELVQLHFDPVPPIPHVDDADEDEDRCRGSRR
jgi:hypothetical protein